MLAREGGVVWDSDKNIAVLKSLKLEDDQIQIISLDCLDNTEANRTRAALGMINQCIVQPRFR